jgi:hypothetical protein
VDLHFFEVWKDEEKKFKKFGERKWWGNLYRSFMHPRKPQKKWYGSDGPTTVPLQERDRSSKTLSFNIAKKAV